MPRPKKEKRVWRPQGELSETQELSGPNQFWLQPSDKSEPPIKVTGYDKGVAYDVARIDDPTGFRILHFKGPNGWIEVSEPKYEVNTHIKTFRPMTSESEWDNTSIKNRKWGVEGVIKVLHPAPAHSGSSGGTGWCEVIHTDGTNGDYNFSELIPL